MSIVFNVIIDPDNATGTDYTDLARAVGTNCDSVTPSTWGCMSPLNVAATQVFNLSSVSGTVADGATVSLYRSGVAQGVSGLCRHVTKLSTNLQILLVNITSASFAFAVGDQWRVDASNLVTISTTGDSNIMVVFDCRCTNGTPDRKTASIQLGGSGLYSEAYWTTTSANYVKVWTDPALGYRHNGTYQTGNKYRIEVAGTGTSGDDGICLVVDPYHKSGWCVVQGIQCQCTNAGSVAIMCHSRYNEGGVRKIEQCIVAVDSFIDGIWMNGPYYVSNNIVYGIGAGAGWCVRANTTNATFISFTGYIYNNTIWGGDVGMRSTGYSASAYPTILAKNNICNNNNSDYETVTFGIFSTSCDRNISQDATAPGTNPKQGAVTFVNVGSYDFHLSGSDTVANGYGGNLTADSLYAISVDIDNQTRPATAAWCCGADELLSAVRNKFQEYGQERGQHWGNNY
jgi:hypothetical protein